MNIRELSDVFTRPPEDCVAVMLSVLDEIRLQNLKLADNLDIFSEWLVESTQRAIHRCESPIEKALVGGLLLGFLFRADRGLLVTEPLANALEDSKRFREALRRRSRLESEWARHVEDHEEDMRHVNPGMEREYLSEYPIFDTFDAYGDHLRDSGKLSNDEFEMLFRHPVVSAGYLAWSAFVLSPQSVFPGLGADGKNARVDLYIWCPAQPHLQMIIECDGYEFHSEKTVFIADRKRDRSLQRAGLDIYRFSGTEIFNDMKKVADEAWLTAVNLRFGLGGAEPQYLHF